jgi:hypothetical protein
VKKLDEEISSRYRVFGISLVSANSASANSVNLSNYVSRYGLSFPVYSALLQVKDVYSLIEVPATVVVSPDGEVLKVWFGAYRDKTRQEIEEYFSIKLPGIAETQ